MAQKKAAGCSRNGRDSHSKRLGIKLYGGEYVNSGNIIVRQRGTKVNAGNGVGIGKDHTLFALRNGYIKYDKKGKGFGKKGKGFGKKGKGFGKSVRVRIVCNL